MAGEWKPLDLDKEIERQLAELHEQAVGRDHCLMQLREDLRVLGALGPVSDIDLRTDLRRMGR